MNISNKEQTIKKFLEGDGQTVNEELLAWQSQLETERDALLQLQNNGNFGDEHAGRLLNIESMLDQIAINQFLS